MATNLRRSVRLSPSEPVHPENIDEMARVAAHTNIPIASGERLVTKFENGFITPPTGPGLGIELNEAVVRRQLISER